MDASHHREELTALLDCVHRAEVLIEENMKAGRINRFWKAKTFCNELQAVHGQLDSLCGVLHLAGLQGLRQELQENQERDRRLQEEMFEKILAKMESLKMERGFLARSIQIVKELGSSSPSEPTPSPSRLSEPRMAPWEIRKSDLTFDETEPSRRGAFGIVRKATFFRSPVAVKEIESSLSMDAVEELKREAMLMMSMPSVDHVVRVSGLCLEDKHPWLVMEWANQDLRQLLDGMTPETELILERQVDLMLQVAESVRMLHKYGILHRDLKSSNILVFEGEHLRLKLADFGLSRVRSESIAQSKASGAAVIGSLPWMAPEVMTGKGCSPESDVFSLGVVLWEIATYGRPWQDVVCEAELREKVSCGHRLPMFDGMNSAVQGVIESCWCALPSNRLSLDEVCSRLEDLLRPAVFTRSRFVPFCDSVLEALGPSLENDTVEMLKEMQTSPEYGTAGCARTILERLARDSDWSRLKHAEVTNVFVDGLVGVLRESEGDPSVQQWGWKVVRALLVHIPNRSRLSQKDIRQSLRSAMTTHAGDPRVQENACATLWSLAVNTENKTILVREGFLPLLKSAMTTHAGDPRVQEYACGTLSNLAVNTENRTILVREGFLPLLKSALSRFPDDSAVVKVCRGALGKLS